MQVNFVHNYSKTFFKGGSPSFKAKAVSDEQPLTAKEFRDEQMQQSQATTKALQAFTGFLRLHATPPCINAPRTQHGANVKAKCRIPAGYKKKPYTIRKPILNYIGVINKPTLNQGDIVKTSKVGDTTTHTMRDGSIVTVKEGLFKTITFDYSNCPNRGENDPIEEIIREPGAYKERFERRWENGAFDCYNVNGDLIRTIIMKSNNHGITFERNKLHGNYYVTHEEGGYIQYPPEYFVIHPGSVRYDENDNLQRIYPDYIRNHNCIYPKINSLDGAISKIQRYSCPLQAIDFYPSGKIKSEHYTFELNDRGRFFEIKFNENGQVDDIIIINECHEVIGREASFKFKQKLNEDGYEGYAKYVPDFKERAGIAHYF